MRSWASGSTSSRRVARWPPARSAAGSSSRPVRPDLVFTELRGNMATRLSKVPEGGAIVVAAVALQRLQLADYLAEIISPDELVPQVGQGAWRSSAAADDADTLALLAAIEHEPSRRRVDAERAFLVELGGDCDLPAGAHAVFVDDVGDVATDRVAPALGIPGHRRHRVGRRGPHAQHRRRPDPPSAPRSPETCAPRSAASA